jgi:alpha-L-rhamnosidase
VFFRHAFSLPARPQRAIFHVAADNEYRLFVNGQPVGAGQSWSVADRYDLARHLRAGRNVLALRARNVSGPAGLLVEGEITCGSQKVKVRSDATWKVAQEAAAGWEQPTFDDAGWSKAEEHGSPPVGPWGEVERTEE